MMALDYRDPSGQYADIRDINERVGRGLMQAVALTHRSALTSGTEDLPIQTVADLRAVRSAVLDVADDAAPVLARVGAQDASIWAWFRFLNEDETASKVRPDDVAVGDPGMWVKQTLPDVACCTTSRYLAHVEYAAAQVENKKLWDRCRGKTPALFISPMGGSLKEVSQTMAYHRFEARYQVRVVSANWRGGVSGRFEPPMPDEAANDPGTERIIGDLRRLLIHDNTLQRLLGVEKVSLGDFRPTFEKSAERILVDSCDVRVIGYVNTPNTPCEVISPWRAWFQLQDELGVNAGPQNQIPAASDG